MGHGVQTQVVRWLKTVSFKACTTMSGLFLKQGLLLFSPAWICCVSEDGLELLTCLHPSSSGIIAVHDTVPRYCPGLKWSLFTAVPCHATYSEKRVKDLQLWEVGPLDVKSETRRDAALH